MTGSEIHEKNERDEGQLINKLRIYKFRCDSNSPRPREYGKLNSKRSIIRVRKGLKITGLKYSGIDKLNSFSLS